MKAKSIIAVIIFLSLFEGGSKAQTFNRPTLSSGNIGNRISLSPGGSPLTVLTPVWSYQLQPVTTRMEYGASPAMVDLGPGVNNAGAEPDNFMEIITGSDEYDNIFPELNSHAYGIWRCFDALGNIEWAVDTKSDEARTSVAVTDINYDLNAEIATGTTSGWCIEVLNKSGSWTPGIADASWTFPYEPQRNGSFMWHSSPAIGEIITGSHHEGLEIVAGNNPLMSIWAFDGDNSDGADDGITVDLSLWGYPGPTGTEGVDWDVLWVFQTGGSIIASPSIGDLNGDGTNEVVCGSYDSILYCLNGATGALVWSYKTGAPITGSAGLADFDNNGKLEVVVGSQDGLVYCIKGDLNGDGIINPAEVTSFTTGGPVYSSAAIADVNNDGNLEIVIGSDDFNWYCLQYSPATNSVTSVWSYPTGNIIHSSAAVANTGRALLTIYGGSSDSVLYVLDGNGTLITSYPSGGEIVTSPAVADIDGDGKLELAYTTWGDPDLFLVLRDPGSNVTAFSAPWPMFRHDTRHTGLYNWAPMVINDDVGVTSILEPEGSVLHGTVMHPQAEVHNFGENSALNFMVTFEIWDESNVLVYSSAETVPVLLAHTGVVVTFTAITATPGSYITKAYVNYPGDLDPDDDAKQGSFFVVPVQWVKDFEADDGGFDASIVPNGWEWGAPSSGPSVAHSGTRLWATNLTGDYGNSASWKLNTLQYVAQQNNPVLSFWHWYNIEQARDGGNLKLSVDGVNWTLLFPVGGYPGIATWDNAGVPDEPCYNGLSGGWQLASFILPLVNGQQFTLRWHLGSDNLATRPGWYVDDVTGYGFGTVVFAASAATPISCHGGLSSVTVTASGGTPPYTGTGSFTVTAGTYTFTVTDAAGISGITAITVTEPDVLMAVAAAVPTPCVGVTSTISANVSGGTLPYDYLWSNGSTIQSNATMAPGSYSVTITDGNGCQATATVTTTVQPATSVSIAPSANPVPSGTTVTYTATVVNGGTTQAYQWKVNGVSTGTSNPVFSYVPANNDAVTCLLTTGEGCTATSNTVTMTVGGIPASVTLQNITVPDGWTVCYNASQTIYVAGSGTTFLVEPGAEVLMIAGHNIFYLPGTLVAQGGKMHGEINATSQNCEAKTPALNVVNNGSGGDFPGNASPVFKLYPNPATTGFTLETDPVNVKGSILVEVWSMHGKRLYANQLPVENKHEFSTVGWPAGIFILRVVNSTYEETIKLVICR